MRSIRSQDVSTDALSGKSGYSPAPKLEASLLSTLYSPRKSGDKSKTIAERLGEGVFAVQSSTRAEMRANSTRLYNAFAAQSGRFQDKKERAQSLLRVLRTSLVGTFVRCAACQP